VKGGISYTANGKPDVTQLEEITKLEDVSLNLTTFKGNRLCGNKYNGQRLLFLSLTRANHVTFN
jgi:hypothetical protein